MRCNWDSKVGCSQKAEPGDVFCKTHASKVDSAAKEDLLFFCQQESKWLAEQADLEFFAAVELV